MRYVMYCWVTTNYIAIQLENVHQLLIAEAEREASAPIKTIIPGQMSIHDKAACPAFRRAHTAPRSYADCSHQAP